MIKKKKIKKCLILLNILNFIPKKKSYSHYCVYDFKNEELKKILNFF